MVPRWGCAADAAGALAGQGWFHGGAAADAAGALAGRGWFHGGAVRLTPQAPWPAGDCISLLRGLKLKSFAFSLCGIRRIQE